MLKRLSLLSASSGLAILTAIGCAAQNRGPASADAPPAAPREFRAAWVATVDNIDWPSKRGLSGTEQQAELIAILDRAVELKLNCLVVQIRTTADALYPSKHEPWSAYLSGTQGVPPNPPYDPLKMWVEEGHKRGIEIHAWFNPYRARFSNAKLELADTHIAKRRPELVKEYGPYLWLDPGEPDAAKHSLAVFNDVVRRYDVDGIHIDDYFYPYPVKAKGPDGKELATDLPFPDDAAWERYKKRNPIKPNPATAPADVERVARDDWRRQNVNELIHEIHVTTKKIKPHVKFGISPFGIGRPGTAPGIKGFDQYDKLYADAALWLNEGWCDYFTPQLYWPIEQKPQSFPVLLDYWKTENKQGRHIWPGLFTSKLIQRNAGPLASASTQPNLWSAQEITNQIEVTRAKLPEGAGHVHFSMKALMKDAGGLPGSLMSSTFAQDALVPTMPWLDKKAPPKPTVKLERGTNGNRVTLRPGSGEETFVYAIWKRTPDGWKFQTAPGVSRSVAVDANVTNVVVTAVDRMGNESGRVEAGAK